jgi:hypothetical protein
MTKEIGFNKDKILYRLLKIKKEDIIAVDNCLAIFSAFVI